MAAPRSSNGLAWLTLPFTGTFVTTPDGKIVQWKQSQESYSFKPSHRFLQHARLHGLLLSEGISFKPSYGFLLHAQLHGL
jgi:hypothetical protein